MKKKNEIAIRKSELTSGHGLDRMIEKVIDSKAPVENLERLLALKEKYENREAEKRFHSEFCKMQGDFPMIRRTHEVKDNSGNLAYKYAALEDILRQVQPVLAKHGFSYSWSEETDGKIKKVFCKISGYGHSESSHVVIPILEGTRMTNAAQMAGSSSTYGKRYSLIGILGIMCEDDDDARSTGRQGTVEPVRVPKNAKDAEVIEFEEMKKDERLKLLTGVVASAKKLKWAEKDLRDFIKTAYKVTKLAELTNDQVLDLDQALAVKVSEA